MGLLMKGYYLADVIMAGRFAGAGLSIQMGELSQIVVMVVLIIFAASASSKN